MSENIRHERAAGQPDESELHVKRSRRAGAAQALRQTIRWLRTGSDAENFERARLTKPYSIEYHGDAQEIILPAGTPGRLPFIRRRAAVIGVPDSAMLKLYGPEGIDSLYDDARPAIAARLRSAPVIPLFGVVPCGFRPIIHNNAAYAAVAVRMETWPSKVALGMYEPSTDTLHIPPGQTLINAGIQTAYLAEYYPNVPLVR